MPYFLGIDVGTSGTKVIAIDGEGSLVASASATYELLTPRPLWAEQRLLAPDVTPRLRKRVRRS